MQSCCKLVANSPIVTSAFVSFIIPRKVLFSQAQVLIQAHTRGIVFPLALVESIITEASTLGPGSPEILDCILTRYKGLSISPITMLNVTRNGYEAQAILLLTKGDISEESLSKAFQGAHLRRHNAILKAILTHPLAQSLKLREDMLSMLNLEVSTLLCSFLISQGHTIPELIDFCLRSVDGFFTRSFDFALQALLGLTQEPRPLNWKMLKISVDVDEFEYATAVLKAHPQLATNLFTEMHPPNKYLCLPFQLGISLAGVDVDRFLYSILSDLPLEQMAIMMQTSECRYSVKHLLNFIWYNINTPSTDIRARVVFDKLLRPRVRELSITDIKTLFDCYECTESSIAPHCQAKLETLNMLYTEPPFQEMLREWIVSSLQDTQGTPTEDWPIPSILQDISGPQLRWMFGTVLKPGMLKNDHLLGIIVHVFRDGDTNHVFELGALLGCVPWLTSTVQVPAGRMLLHHPQLFHYLLQRTKCTLCGIDQQVPVGPPALQMLRDPKNPHAAPTSPPQVLATPLAIAKWYRIAAASLRRMLINRGARDECVVVNGTRVPSWSSIPGFRRVVLGSLRLDAP
ncbi:hypothetical protein Pelo_2888 [Pelomyxa schiedti]|nr:hypothetical protein Pelo_2888 [Pelomyxa schiedti]